MNGNVIRTITIRGTSEGLDKLQADLNKVAAAQENVAVVSEQSAKRVLSLEDAWKRQTLKLDEAARAQANIARETKIADSALREGLATQAQHAQRLEQINQRYSTVTTATKGFAQQTGLARHELINLGRQAQDVGVSLASGQSPLMVLVQQGSQIADVFISSGKSVGSFFSQAVGWAGRFFTSTAGIVTGIAAIGAAAVYAASQFVRASTTIEEALENQNRLLKEGKALVDARTSAEARAQLQSKDLTQFEIARNLLDLQNKLNKAKEDAGRSVSRPTEVPGEMGVAPTGAAASVKEFTAAFGALKTAQAAGLPALKEFIAELAKAGQAHPALAQTVEDMIKLARAGLDLEMAEMRLRAISDALKGVATNAQLAAVGLGSIAQFKLNNLMAEQAKEATERMAAAILKMAQDYPGMSIEVAKTLEALKGQLSVAQALGGAAQMEAQHRATINQLLLEGKTLQEATAIADARRALSQAQINASAQETLFSLQQQAGAAGAVGVQAQIAAQAQATYNTLVRQGVDAQLAAAVAAQEASNAQARINAAHQVRLVALRGELAVAQQVTGIGQIMAQHEATINNLKMQGLSLSQATAEADLQRAIALARVEANAEKTLKNLQNENELIRARTEEEKAGVKARQTYEQLVEDGVSTARAGDIATQQHANAMEQAAIQRTQAYRAAADAAQEEAFAMRMAAEAAVDAARAVMAFVPFGTGSSGSLTYVQGKNIFQSNQGGYSQFNPAGYESNTEGLVIEFLANQYGRGGFDMVTGAPNAQGQAYLFNKLMGSGNTQQAISSSISGGLVTAPFGAYADKGTPFVDTAKISILQRAIETLPKEQQAGPLQQLLGAAQNLPRSLESTELIQQLNDKLQQLISATEANTGATSAMTDVLSPFYSSDPRRTHLGFRAFAGGGIMTQYGELPLRHYQGGGMATSPQVAVFGEGSTPEAYVPVPSGRIPVEIKQPANSNLRPIRVTINVMGNASPRTVGALKSTAFQQAQAMRRVTG